MSFFAKRTEFSGKDSNIQSYLSNYLALLTIIDLTFTT